MASLKAKLKCIIKEDLKGEADLETQPNGDVCGHVISPLFEGKDYHDRRVLIREALLRHKQQGKLSDEERLHVSTLLTYTPDEWNVVLTDTQD